MKDSKTYKACDRCRQRKRGCDGELPCSNCKWAKCESDCKYSAIPNVWRTNVSKMTCDQCRQKKRKCNGGFPCDVCLKSKHKDEMGIPVCTYKRKRDSEEERSPTPQVTPPRMDMSISGDVDILIPETFLNTADIVNLIEPSFPPLIQPQLEQHLFHLVSIVLQAVPLRATDKREIVSATGVPLGMNSCLKNALFASASMFSTHPMLYPNGASLKQRIEVARGYASKAIQYINFELISRQLAPLTDTFTRPGDPIVHLTYENVDIGDVIRSLLSLAQFSYGIGEGGMAIKLVQEACLIGNLLGVFAFKTGPRPKPLWSVDSLVLRTNIDIAGMIPQTASEEQERFLLWASCLVLDTYCSMESGQEFTLNEQLYPDFCAGWRPRSPHKHIQPPGRIPTQGRHTVWENGPYGPMFDRVSDICTYDMYPHSTSSTFNHVVWISVIARRILRVVRARAPITKSESDDIWWKETVFIHPSSIKYAYMPINRDVTPGTLHDSLLLWYANLSDRARPFPSLESFIEPFANPQTDDYFWSYAAPAVEGTLLFLSSFCYLHMGSLDYPESSRFFRLSVPRYGDFSTISQYMEQYSSREVLLVCLLALSFMLRRFLDREQPAMSSEIPSPIQYWAIQPLEIFIVASSGLLATRVAPFREQEFMEAFTLVNSVILPTLTRYCKIWPMGLHYKTKLETLLSNLQV